MVTLFGEKKLSPTVMFVVAAWEGEMLPSITHRPARRGNSHRRAKGLILLIDLVSREKCFVFSIDVMRELKIGSAEGMQS